MKMKRVSVKWEKTVEVVVYLPEDMSDRDLSDIAHETADSIDRDGWDCGWHTFVSRSEVVDVPDAERAVTSSPGGRWLHPVEGSRFRRDNVMVVGDGREDVVNPMDAGWWVATDAEGGTDGS